MPELIFANELVADLFACGESEDFKRMVPKKVRESEVTNPDARYDFLLQRARAKLPRRLRKRKRHVKFPRVFKYGAKKTVFVSMRREYERTTFFEPLRISIRTV